MSIEGEAIGNYYSKFGGLWIDNRNRTVVEDRIEKIADAELRQSIKNFVRDGFVIIPGAVSSQTIDAYLQEYEDAADKPDLLCLFGDSFSREKSRKPGAKVCDTVMTLPTGPELSFSPKIGRFLEEIFEDKALAFQSLHFEMGSTQGIHQDTAYVVVQHEPLKLIASWIALEDIEPGTGELIYYVGGHRIREYTYGDYKNFDPSRDPETRHAGHIDHLHQEAARLGLPLGKFSAKKGDVLLWHADLPHGGGEITKPGRTRRSLVTHYCPKSMTPHHWRFIPEDWRRKTEVRDGHAFTSDKLPPPEIKKPAGKALSEDARAVVQPRLEVRSPSHQNAIDLFGDRWFTRIEEVFPGLKSGPHNFLKGDSRPVLAAQHLGFIPGSLHNMRVCELGPMEGMHTYQLVNLGAESVIAVESNSQSYLRCLVLKEILQHKGRFLLGDALKFLQDNDTRYDMIFCSGVLYHMNNPYELIKAMARRTDRIFLSTHYYDPDVPKGPACRPKNMDCDGTTFTFYEHAYNVDITTESFWGGNQPTACWLRKGAIRQMFSNFGFAMNVLSDMRDWDAGHHITAALRRP